jgi:ribose-phosphate pyrophosphokinase
MDHLHAFPVLNGYIKSLNIPINEFVVLSPDEGNVKRVLRHQKKLGGQIAIVDKRRISGSEVQQVNLIGGPLDGKVAVIFDDMISTGGSVVGAAQVAMKFGARKVIAAVTHAVFCGPALERMRDSSLSEVVVTDSIVVPGAESLPNLRVLSVAPLIADAIKRIHGNQSVSVLFE